MNLPSLVERYAHPPGDIERLSRERLDKALGGRWPWSGAAREVAARMLLAAGDPGLAGSLAIRAGAVEAGVAALGQGAPLVTDTRMVAAGIDRRRARRLGCTLRCTLAAAPPGSGGDGSPRSVVAVRRLAARGDFDRAVAVIGVAPTALLALLDAMDAGTAHPALVIGTPVGLVAAAEAKEELTRREVPYITVLGHRGGSALAAAAVNALLFLAAGGREQG